MDEKGNSLLFGKAFSQKSSIRKVIEHIQTIGQGKTLWNYIMLHANNNELAQETADKIFSITGLKPVAIVNISPVIGMHAGKGAVAISLLYNS